MEEGPECCRRAERSLGTPSGAGDRPRMRVYIRERIYVVRASFTLHGNTAHSVLWYTVKVAGGGPSVHACAVFFGAESRDGDT